MAASSTKAKGDTDTATEAKGRFVVSLPADVGEMIGGESFGGDPCPYHGEGTRS